MCIYIIYFFDNVHVHVAKKKMYCAPTLISHVKFLVWHKYILVFTNTKYYVLVPQKNSV